jgi:2-keto-4-pentenoate hydratase/2-oxohepta-3-ene-1,7-dioic acid hydratase in catechol pathway
MGSTDVKLAIFDDYRLGVVLADGAEIADVTEALPGPHDPDPFGAGWWLRLCRDFSQTRPQLEQAASRGRRLMVADVHLRAPVLNPGKIVAAAANYAAHRDEMKGISARVGAATPAWLSNFDVFLKAPSSIVGPSDAVILPSGAVAEGKEVHHESELAVVIGAGGTRIPEHDALRHVLGYTIGLDMTVRGEGDRSRRKSYDTFTPLGPWLVTSDEIGDPQALEIGLTVNGTVRQQVHTSTMLTPVAQLIAYASEVMRLDPGDVIVTGAPPGVGPVVDGDQIETWISGIGRMRLPVRRSTDAARR